MKHAHLIYTLRDSVTSCDACGQLVGTSWQCKRDHWRGWADSIYIQREERIAKLEGRA